VPRTLQGLASAGAATGNVFLGLLQTILAVMVPNGTGIELGVQVDHDGEPCVCYTHAGPYVFWSRAVVAGQPVCTITLLLVIFASVQNVPFVCVHPIGSHILGRGGNITIGNYACRAGRIGRRRVELDTKIRAVLISKLGTAVAAGVIGLLDSPTNVALRARLARHRMQHEDVDEADEEDMDDEVKIYCIYNDNTSST
jgi:hypothetical protein